MTTPAKAASLLRPAPYQMSATGKVASLLMPPPFQPTPHLKTLPLARTLAMPMTTPAACAVNPVLCQKVASGPVAGPVPVPGTMACAKNPAMCGLPTPGPMPQPTGGSGGPTGPVVGPISGPIFAPVPGVGGVQRIPVAAVTPVAAPVQQVSASMVGTVTVVPQLPPHPCLTKVELLDGRALFRDLCTNQAAISATPTTGQTLAVPVQ